MLVLGTIGPEILSYISMCTLYHHVPVIDPCKLKTPNGPKLEDPGCLRGKSGFRKRQSVVVRRPSGEAGLGFEVELRA